MKAFDANNEKQKEKDELSLLGHWIDCFSFLVSFSFVLFSFGLISNGYLSFVLLVFDALHLRLSLHLWTVPLHAPNYGLITANASHEKKIIILICYFHFFFMCVRIRADVRFSSHFPSSNMKIPQEETILLILHLFFSIPSHPFETIYENVKSPDLCRRIHFNDNNFLEFSVCLAKNFITENWFDSSH